MAEASPRELSGRSTASCGPGGGTACFLTTFLPGRNRKVPLFFPLLTALSAVGAAATSAALTPVFSSAAVLLAAAPPPPTPPSFSGGTLTACSWEAAARPLGGRSSTPMADRKAVSWSAEISPEVKRDRAPLTAALSSATWQGGRWREMEVGVFGRQPLVDRRQLRGLGLRRAACPARNKGASGGASGVAAVLLHIPVTIIVKSSVHLEHRRTGANGHQEEHGATGRAAMARAAPDDEPLTGWQRVGRLAGYAFKRQEPGEEVPPMPEELREWAQDTLTATLVGLVFGGGKQWIDERGAGAPQAPPGAPTKLHAARAIAEENTQRLSRVANASVRGGLHFGGLAAAFYAVQVLSGVYRGRRDFLDAAHGGMAAGALFGLSLHRSMGMRASPLRSLVLGAALGASLGIPLGLLQDKVASLLPEEHRAARLRRQLHTEAVIAGTVRPERVRAAEAARPYDVAGAIIQQLEASLSSSPTRQQQQQGQQGQKGRP
ncbi:hypothetical protein CHLNCDRAFT_49731 [Chlorella variabilis]|uniref:Complex I assembly factor TIMMDC1, mitochondrial n=1 Tax=Chlorella variabilis TaxID=554065 RepID=E1Z3K1_CHLVA|nr:hypothetical protein CHLNCDRAFT_49731 [Chlorella variabilis]EFN59863.1 hypothetical protein CHLNCDRAFT_49731 [Chlorella variabilis]|eukprot:XP_005851965.1 hypothetical protein CHLNCDRAFT_49731 [Chlorella variabilis]